MHPTIGLAYDTMAERGTAFETRLDTYLTVTTWGVPSVIVILIAIGWTTWGGLRRHLTSGALRKASKEIQEYSADAKENVQLIEGTRAAPARALSCEQ